MASVQPWPESPRPWKKKTVAVCWLTAGKIKGATRRTEDLDMTRCRERES